MNAPDVLNLSITSIIYSNRRQSEIKSQMKFNTGSFLLSGPVIVAAILVAMMATGSVLPGLLLVALMLVALFWVRGLHARRAVAARFALPTPKEIEVVLTDMMDRAWTQESLEAKGAVLSVEHAYLRDLRSDKAPIVVQNVNTELQRMKLHLSSS